MKEIREETVPKNVDLYDEIYRRMKEHKNKCWIWLSKELSKRMDSYTFIGVPEGEGIHPKEYGIDTYKRITLDEDCVWDKVVYCGDYFHTYAYARDPEVIFFLSAD